MIRTIALAALMATPAAAESRWSMSYDLAGTVTASGPSAEVDLSAAYRVGQHSHLFISAHTPLVKPKPYLVDVHTETIHGACPCVTINTTVNAYIGADDMPSIRAGLAWDWGRNVTAQVYLEGVRKGPPMIGAQVSIHGRMVGGE